MIAYTGWVTEGLFAAHACEKLVLGVRQFVACQSRRLEEALLAAGTDEALDALMNLLDVPA